MSIESLRPALDPQSIALIGASENANKIGGRPLAYLGRFGYRGRVYPINPKRAEVQGHKSYADLAALPEVPEMAVIALPGDGAIEAVESCAARGVKIAVVMSSGFGETGSAEGKAKERRMVAAARAHGMRMIGPNAQGLANFGSGAIASFSTMFIEQAPADGPVAVVSQSGAMSVVPYGLLRRRGIGVRHAHATGNDADVSVAELSTAIAADPAVKLLLLYLESIPDPHHLAEAARLARERELPIVALKSGRTAAGQRAAQSHTGALANEDRVVDAFLEHLGIWRVPDVAGLVAAAELYLKGWRPSGRRLVAVSNSGATCVMAADAATMAGMSMAPLEPATREALARVLPSFATTTNPVDITAALLSNSRLLSDILPILARDPAADAFLIGIPVAGTGYDVDAFARDTAAFAAATGKPVIVAAPQPNVGGRFKAEGLAVYELEAQAIAALSQFIGHSELMARLRRRPIHDWPRHREARHVATRVLNEAESLALVAAHGVRVVPHRLCRSAAEAQAAFREIGSAVAVKGCSADVSHKSELGLVRLGLHDEAAVAAAFRDLEDILHREGARCDGVIVAAMQKGRHELVIGAHRDPVFGPVVVIGEGGKYVEALPDLRVLLPPFGADEVREALGRLRLAPILAGLRGEPPLDVAAFCEAAVVVGRMMLDPAQRIASLDLNPVLLGGAGEGYAAVDAVAIVEAS
ncbi:MAG TPA: acetate--CoA ligase family protein [Alphaproteobacteria bacterium]|nr:acetate--CoA ligase family protein [Alphaproteobacteria bacterium]